MKSFEMMLDLCYIFKGSGLFVIIYVKCIEIVLFEVHSEEKMIIFELTFGTHLNRVSSPHSARICSSGSFGRLTSGLPS